MNSEILAALVGAGAAVITSTIGILASHRRIMKVLKEKRLEDISEKQLTACEEIWSLLLPLSMSGGSKRVIRDFKTEPTFDKSAAVLVIEGINKVFNEPHGLYTSRNLRAALFRFRDFLEDEMVTKWDDNKKLTRSEATTVFGQVTALRIALRDEIGVRDPGLKE